MNNIILIGLPGAGKTTFGYGLAKKLEFPFYDADDYLEDMTGERIPDMFEKGEEYFRDRETEALRELAKKNGVVIATGGGAVKREENMDILRKSGKIIFIDRDPDDIATDVDVVTRPLLFNGPMVIFRLYDERIKLYRAAADIIIKNNKDMATVMQKIYDASVEALNHH